MIISTKKGTPKEELEKIVDKFDMGFYILPMEM